MAATSKRTDLLAALKALTAGPLNPSDIDLATKLVRAVQDFPWRDELVFVLKNYEPEDEATGSEALRALARQAIGDWDGWKAEPRWRLSTPADAKDTDKRWLDEDGRARAIAVAQALRGTAGLRNLAFGTYDGRLDLRGYVDPRTERGFVSRSLEDVDFSGARIVDLSFMNARVIGSRFDGVYFDDLRFFSVLVQDTTFRGARFPEIPSFAMNEPKSIKGSRPFGPRRFEPASRYERVDFSDANLSNASFRNATLIDCDFSNARLNRASFACELIHCRFAGHLHDVLFLGPARTNAPIPPRYEAVDLSGAELHYVGFRGVDMSAFRLPSHHSTATVQIE